MIDATKNGNNIAGIGSGFNKAVDSGASLVTGAITGDIVGGIAGASAPYLATAIKNATGHYDTKTEKWEMDNQEGNYVLHGMLGAGVAALQGNSALAGAVGAAGGEYAANTIRDNFYDGKDTKDLTESEKQDISNWSQIASGAAAFAGSGGNMGDASTAMSASKNAVENNSLSGDKAREDLKSITEDLKQKVRDAGGENQVTAYINGAVIIASELGDTGLATVDTAFDVLALITTCALGDSYCSQAKADYAKINGTIAANVDALFISGKAWTEIGKMIDKANNGDQVAQENTIALMASILSPSKLVSGKIVNGVTKVEELITNTNKISKVENAISDASTINKIENSVSDINKIEKINTTSVVVEYSPLNKGPLPEKIADTFRSGTYKEVITTDTTSLYRVYGGNSKELGPYWTIEKPSGPVQSIIDSALDPKWGNTATKVVEIKVPAGIKFYEGIAGKQSGLVGGGNQIFFIDKVDQSWIVK